MKNVGPTRVELGTRTIFNLLGPLSNPAGVKRQMVGVFSRQWVEPLAQVLKNLGSDSVWVVHGSDGLDEITITGPTYVAALENGADAHLRDHARGGRLHAPEAGGAARRRCRRTMPTALRRRAQGRQGPVPRRRAAERGGRAGRRRPREGPQGRRRAGRASRSTPAPPRRASTASSQSRTPEAAMADILTKIEAYKREEIAAAKRARAPAAVESRRQGRAGAARLPRRDRAPARAPATMR